MPLNATALETLLEQVEAWRGRKQRHLVAEAEAGERGAARQAATPDRAGVEGAGGAAAEASTLAQQWEVRVGVGHALLAAEERGLRGWLWATTWTRRWGVHHFLALDGWHALGYRWFCRASGVPASPGH